MSHQARTPLSVLDEVLCTAVAIGLVLVLLLPAARGMSTIGWLPMWLVGMPLLGWWALHGFALPGRTRAVATGNRRVVSARRPQPQARRSARPARPAGARHAA